MSYETWLNAPTQITKTMSDGTEVTYDKRLMTRGLPDDDADELTSHLIEIRRILARNGSDGIAVIRLWISQGTASVDATSWASAKIEMGDIDLGDVNDE